MRPAEFASEEIVAAGEALKAAGRNVTGFALRQRVGGGDAKRLKQVWDEHVASNTAAEFVPVAELPVEVAEEVAAVSKSLTERISQLAVDMNDKAVKAAERRVTEVVRAAGEQREQAERELSDATQTVDDLEAALDKGQTEIAALGQRLSESQLHSQSQAVELAQLRERIASMEKGARATGEAHARKLADIEAGALKLRSELEAARDGLVTARTTAEQAELRANDLRAELHRAHAEGDELRGELASANARIRALEERVSSLSGELFQAKADETSLQKQRTQAVFEAERVALQLAAAQAECEEARKDSAKAREESARLQGRVEALAEQNAALLASVKSPEGSGGGKVAGRTPKGKQ